MNREKVIKGIDICLKNIDKPDCSNDCPYLSDCSKYENRVVFQPLMRDALALLKEQEAVKPVEEFIKGANRYEYHCKRCGNIVGTIFDDKHPIFPGAKLSIKHFCDVCGQAVKWE